MFVLSILFGAIVGCDNSASKSKVEASDNTLKDWMIATWTCHTEAGDPLKLALYPVGEARFYMFGQNSVNFFVNKNSHL